MRNSRCALKGAERNYSLARALTTLGMVSAGIFWTLGGCPGGAPADGANPDPIATPVTVVAGESDETPNGSQDPETGGGGSQDPMNPEPNDPPMVDGSDGAVATFQDRPVTILLSAPDQGRPITFQVVTPPLHGLLSEFTQMDDSSANITFTPGLGFVGPTYFTYRIVGDDTVVNMNVSVYPLVQFSVTPTDGQRDLQVTVTAHTVGDFPLPEGTYTWSFDGVTESGPLSTHTTRTRAFTTGGTHTIGLAVLFAGLAGSTTCRADENLPTEHGFALVSVWPRISGTIRNSGGQPLSNIVVVSSGRATSSMTDVNGRYQISVPMDWSGTVTPSPLGHTFDPPNRTYTTVRADVDSQDYESATPTGNQQPSANAQNVGTNEDTTRAITLTGSDPEGAALRYVITTLPANGALRDDGTGATIPANQLPYTLVNNGNRATFIPNTNYNGGSSFQFAVNDGSNTPNAQSSAATVSIAIAPVNDTPTAQPQSVAVQPNSPTSVTLQGNDVDGDLLTYSIVSNPQHGTLSGSGANRTYTPANGYQGQDSFSFRVTDPSTAFAQAAVTLNVSPFQPPIGVPTPTIGIVESHTMYASRTFNFGSGPVPYPNAGNGPYTHYVDNTHPQATDDNNTFGTPNRPRNTIPRPLPAGAVVEVHGGPYQYGPGYAPVYGQGTATDPIFIRGVGNPRFNTALSIYSNGSVHTQYMIFEGLSLQRWECIGPASYIALRNCEVSGSSVAIGGESAARPVSNVLVRNCTIHDGGDWQAEFDQDVHGCVISSHSSSVWILDCEMYHNSGDGVQINAANLNNMPTLHHIYIGRNLAWENKQTGFWTKQATDVIFSQNTVHSMRPIGTSPSAWGAGMGFQYGPERVWFIYNHIYNCNFGIQANSSSGLGNGTECFIVGNLIHDIRHDPNYGYNPGTAWAQAGMTIVGVPVKWIINNTIYAADAGINLPAADEIYIENNIIANIVEPQGKHFFLESTQHLTQKVIEHNLFYQPNGAARFRWDQSNYNLAQFRAATGTAATCVEANPQFVDPTTGNYRLQPSSPAVNGGVTHQVYTRFQQLYGQSIAVDFERASRPQGGAFDMGAYER